MQLFRPFTLAAVFSCLFGASGAHAQSGGGCNEPQGQTDSQQVEAKPEITSKPEPAYTRDAREGKVEGVVRLRVVLAASGKVTDIKVLEGLPNGLTKQAIKAARKIKFTPAEKDGHKVSQYAVIEYHFEIY
ncbi:MAG: energy transducer TonB [Pyrinomonadaceae bacterium]